jgi:hypothetical protein
LETVTVQAKQQGRVGNFVYVKAGLYFRLFLIRPYPPVLRGGKTTRYGQAAMERLKLKTNPNLD